MKIGWDEPKRRANVAKHGLDFSGLTLDFFEGALVIGARRPRWKAIGLLDDQLVVAVFALLGSEAVAIVSLRRASRMERRFFDERKARR